VRSVDFIVINRVTRESTVNLCNDAKSRANDRLSRDWSGGYITSNWLRGRSIVSGRLVSSVEWFSAG